MPNWIGLLLLTFVFTASGHQACSAAALESGLPPEGGGRSDLGSRGSGNA